MVRKVNGITANRCYPIGLGDPMVRKKTVSELEQAEIKLQSLLEKRTLLNQEAQLLRQERDLVHETKRGLTPALHDLRDKRAALAAEARAHREKRDELQSKAKALIELKRKMRGSASGDVGAELRAVKRRASQMEMRQQTASLTLPQENELLDELKKSLKRLKELEALKADQDKVAKEVRDLDSGITELFEAAEKEHRSAVTLGGQARAVHEETLGLAQQIGKLNDEGNEKHAAYLEARAKADEVHAKVVEMRDKVLSIWGAQRAEAREARDAIRQQNRQVRRTLLDPKKLEDSADEALKALLEKGRVEIGR